VSEAKRIRVRVPGKAMLAGEYAVLAGAPAIVVAVAKYLECVAEPAERLSIEGAGARWSEGEPETPELRFARRAIRTVGQYLAGKGERLPALRLSITDDLRAPDGQKLGLGGSACTSVAVTAAGLAAAGRELDQALIFKLAAIAHGAAQGKPGSAVDVAACTFGGTIWTRKFDVEPYLGLLDGAPVVFAAAVDKAALPELERLPDSRGLALVFTGKSASTPVLVGEIERFAERAPRQWAEFVARTANACDRLRRALLEGDERAACAALDIAGRLLQTLGEQAGVEIVTWEHREIAERAREAGGAAKVSGAGGGDCAVVLGGESAGRNPAGSSDSSAFVLAPEFDRNGVHFEC